jgi:hypothetical protein
VTRTVYLQEIASAERRARRRASMAARYGAMLEAPLEAPSTRQAAADGGSPAAGEVEIVAWNANGAKHSRRKQAPSPYKQEVVRFEPGTAHPPRPL